MDLNTTLNKISTAFGSLLMGYNVADEHLVL